MIRYGGWINDPMREEFTRFVVDGKICFCMTIENSSAAFYIVYFTSRTDELVFRLKYPKMIKEVDDATI